MSSCQSIFILRHGERLDYVDLLWKRKLKDCPSDDPPLAPKGFLQAREAAERLSRENFDFIISSPFRRCVETAHIVANVVQKPIFIEPGICEILWTFPAGYQSVSRLKEQFPLIDESYNSALVHQQKERFDIDCYQRVSQSVSHILNAYPDKNFLFVSHRSPIAGLFKSLVDRPYFVGLCTLSKLEKVDGKWKSIFSGDSKHLSDKTNLRAN